MATLSMKKVGKKKEFGNSCKEQNKQMKISSFFSASRNVVTSNSVVDNTQSKISKYFSSSKTDTAMYARKTSNGRINKSTKYDSGNNKVFEEIDLTEDEDTAKQIKIPLSPLKNRLPSGIINDQFTDIESMVCEKIKVAEKENSPIKKHGDETPDVKLLNGVQYSPDVIMPTPPKNSDAPKQKGTKRKFDFSDISSTKKLSKIGSKKLGNVTKLFSKNVIDGGFCKNDLESNDFIEKCEIKINGKKESITDDNVKRKLLDIEDASNNLIIQKASALEKLIPMKDPENFKVISEGNSLGPLKIKSCKNPNQEKNEIRDNISKKMSKKAVNIKSKRVINILNEPVIDLSVTKEKCSDNTDNTNSYKILDFQKSKPLYFESGESVNSVCSESLKSEDYICENIVFDEWNHATFTPMMNRDMNLEKCKRCEVLSVDYSNSKNSIIRIKDSFSSSITDCFLLGSWAGLILREGDSISIVAEWNDKLGWTVTDISGYAVLEPDILVAGTTLVGSLFCMRRSILTDMFRGLDPNSEIMVIGSLLHQVLQEVLKQKLRNKYDIEKVVNNIISSNDFVFMLYSSNIAMGNVKKQLDIFLPQIVKFISTYIHPTSNCSPANCWKGEITAIEDIEENIWATNLGLKGKIDVTVKVSSQNKNKIMPLELKTGRASFSSEHRGQVILYTLMMSEISKNVDSGLLLYLREGVMKEVKAGVMEKRDLILLRNELIRFTRERQETVNIRDGIIGAPNLPEPINNSRGCSSCPYLTICSAALKETGLENLPSKNPLNGLAFPATDHLKSDHIRFVFHWVGLLQLEDKEIKQSKFSVKDIWSLNPEEREKNGSGLCNLKLEGEVVENDIGKYKHTFIRDDEFSFGIIAKGDYIIVSTEERVAVASGIVSDISKCSCTIHLDRDLFIYKNLKFHLDRYESQTALMFNMTNLGYLLEAAPECGWLRDKIISLDLPVYSRLSSEILHVCQDILSKLNKGQKHAVLQALAAQHYLLIKGMPGTGKTATLVSLVELLVRLGQSVIVTSHTHSAVDNLIRRLPNKIKILRLGSLGKVHPDIHKYSEQNITASTPEELEEIFHSKQVVGVTCLGAGHPLLRRRKFDVAIVDEATQVLLPTTLRPLYAASRFILVGDPKQLPPLVKSKQASELGLRQSLFSHLDRSMVTAELSVQYRMNKCIMDLANKLTYDGKLECGNEDVGQATISLQRIEVNLPKWMSLVLSSSLDNSVVVLDSGFDDQAKSSNLREGEYVLQMVKTFLKVGLSESHIGIIAPFQAQVALIKTKFKRVNIDVEVSTVDTFQGRDKDLIIYSCTRSSHASEFGLLSDHNRLTVAITRARHKLIFIGDVQTLKSYSIFQKLFTLIDPSNFIKIPLSSV